MIARREVVPDSQNDQPCGDQTHKHGNLLLKPAGTLDLALSRSVRVVRYFWVRPWGVHGT